MAKAQFIPFPQAAEIFKGISPAPAHRLEALARFQLLGLPTTNFEPWHYTDAKIIANQNFKLRSLPRQETPLPPFRWRESPYKKKRTPFPLDELNQALASYESYELKGKDKNLNFDDFWTIDGAGTQAHTRRYFHVAPNSTHTISIHHKSIKDDLSYFTTTTTLMDIAEGAHVTLYLPCSPSSQGISVHLILANLQKNAHFEVYGYTRGGLIHRLETHINLEGDSSVAHINTAVMLKDKRHADITNRINHHAPHCPSNQLCKVVLDDHSHGVFQGKTFVAREAQKTDGYQLNQNLMLSRKAIVDTKPELEIYADDVKCSHGATTGALEEQALFYLQSRGLDKEAAQRLLVEGFLNTAFEGVENEHFLNLWKDAFESYTL